MKFSSLLSLTLTTLGGAAAGRLLQRRHGWEAGHRRVAICVDLDDVLAVALRADRPLDDVLHELAHHGATHASLPELTLNRLRASGALTPRAPARTGGTRAGGARAGGSETRPYMNWNHFNAAPELVGPLAAELAARLPYTGARVSGASTLAFAGDLAVLGEIGLGFDAGLAERVRRAGLDCVPRPVSYAWPEDRLIDLTLAQAAVFGRLVAFDGDLILGHEMHLDATLRAMEREGLALVYFAESRHQKGDWFVAKRRAPHVVLAHRFTPAEMTPLDFHAAAHHWAHLARERGLRLCYVNAFKVLHAAEPLELLHYVEHIREALEHAGFQVTKDVCAPTPAPGPDRRDLALVGLASAGAAAAAVNAALDLPEAAGGPLTVVAAGGAAALPFLERPRSELEALYPPSYAPKALALAAAAFAPAAAVQLARREGAGGWAVGVVMQAGTAAALAAATSGPDYALRIETYKGFNLDWALPLAAAALTLPEARSRFSALALIAGLWALANPRHPDLLARFDPAHAEGHTHHLSAAARLAGDLRLALGPQPARKWAGLGPFATALSVVLARHDRQGAAAVAAAVGALGGALGLVGFRRPERALAVTLREAGPSFAAGAALGALALLAGRRPNDE